MKGSIEQITFSLDSVRVRSIYEKIITGHLNIYA